MQLSTICTIQGFYLFILIEYTRINIKKRTHHLRNEQDAREWRYFFFSHQFMCVQAAILQRTQYTAAQRAHTHTNTKHTFAASRARFTPTWTTNDSLVYASLMDSLESTRKRNRKKAVTNIMRIFQKKKIRMAFDKFVAYAKHLARVNFRGC